MCDAITRAIDLVPLSRRALILGAGGVAAAGTVATMATAPAAQAKNRPIGDGDAHRYRTRLVLLGTAGGPVWWPGTDREGIGSAVVVDGDVYVVDFGDGSGKRLKQAALVDENLQTPGGQWGLERLQAMFITHLHSDHVGDYFNYFMLGWSNGNRNRVSDVPVQVYGPGKRVDSAGNDVLTPIFSPSGGPLPEIPLINPENPVPGTVDMTNYLYQAFALDLNDRMRDSRKEDLRTIFDVHDIAIPASVNFHPNTNHHPEMDPFVVHEDDKVKVTATLVDHFPLSPAFGFRFDTDDGSIVFSGDTAPSANLIKLAKGADILVHEVITTQWVDILFPPPRTEVQEALRNHLLTAHTVPEDAGKVAAEAGVSSLVFSHIVPGNAKDNDLMVAKKHFSGRIVVGNDLMQFGVGKPR